MTEATDNSTAQGRGVDYRVVCSRSVIPYFRCGTDHSQVPYTLLCDFHPDCTQGQDEDFCVVPECSYNQFRCGNTKQCYNAEMICDNEENCRNGIDEDGCKLYPKRISLDPPPTAVYFDGRGSFFTRQLQISSSSDVATCPDTHFQCAGNVLCLPVFVLCNGVYDCPGREDEAACDSSTPCVGFYRCRASLVCLHPQHVCDGVPQCPQRDDELLCHLHCPDVCTCHGLAFICRRPFSIQGHNDLRFLDVSDTGVTPQQLQDLVMLTHLSLSGCGLTETGNVSLPNLHSLDLSENQITSVTFQSFQLLQNLRNLTLSKNPIMSVFSDYQTSHSSLRHMKILSLSGVAMRWFDASCLLHFPHLQELSLRGSGVKTIQRDGFQPLKNLTTLDLRGCPMTSFPRNLFQGLSKLSHVLADNYKLCCSQVLPTGFTKDHCQALVNELSSCQALLRSAAYRICLAVLALLTLVGNLISFTLRVLLRASSRANSSKSAYSLFVTHLSLSDGLMGVYLSVIGVADRVYLGSYLWEDEAWRHSVTCTLAGVVALLSVEVSALIIVLITLDRFLVLNFPFSQLRFHRRSAMLACAGVWGVGVVLATVPLLVPLWEFYQQTGICIPLPISRVGFAGQRYSFGVMVVMNFVLFLLIAVGQVSIYLAVRDNSLTGETVGRERKTQDVDIARRLLSVAMTDFLCWFPVGLLGLLAWRQVPIASEVGVGLAVFVLPLNSAINPFLYTLNTVFQHRARAREEKLLKLLEQKTLSQ